MFRSRNRITSGRIDYNDTPLSGGIDIDIIDTDACPANDHQALAARILRVLTDPELAARLSTNGLRWADQHSWTKIAARIEQLYREFLPK